MLYGANDLDEALLATGRYLHHGSISFISPANREATLRAIALMKSEKRLISYDPNIRLNLWPDPLTAREGVLLGLSTADVLKVSEEEMEFITGHTDLTTGMRALRAQGIPVVVVTLGERGCTYAWGDLQGNIPARRADAVDTTGAGDAFVAGMLYRLTQLNLPPTELERDAVEDLLTFANAVARRVVMRRGAIPAMPTLAEIAEEV